MMTMMKYVVSTGGNVVDTWNLWYQNHRSPLILSYPLLYSPLLLLT